MDDFTHDVLEKRYLGVSHTTYEQTEFIVRKGFRLEPAGQITFQGMEIALEPLKPF